MTSMPASRSARATTLAPRSWPSSPGLAMSTRIFFSLMNGSRARGGPRSALAEDREDHDVVIGAFAVELVGELAFLDEPVGLEHVLRALVVIEYVDPQLAEVHLVE